MRVTTTPSDPRRPVILWFRRDLRLADNPALNAAMETGRPILPLYILDTTRFTRAMGAASRWWLDQSLRALDAALRERGSRLILRSGDPEGELRRLIDQSNADQVFMNRLFEPDAFVRDADIAHALKDDGVVCRGFNGALLAPPGGGKTAQGQPYKVFTPFLRTLTAQMRTPSRTPAPTRIATPSVPSEALEDWNLHPRWPDWSAGFDWTPGEHGADQTLTHFLKRGLPDYARDRDHPARAGASRLSPHLHWGEIAPWRVAERVRAASAPSVSIEKFVAELAWRDFSAHLLHAFPSMTDAAFRPEYDSMPWRDDQAGFRAWRRGRTGYPMVDAGMRQLWVTGWMHNRARMIAASFLVKHLLIDWRLGEAWFWDTLVDADLASNVQNWQWVAGSGADAAPYFRIYNPMTQGRTFDADGAYVRRWIPEIAALPDRWLHAPWEAPAEVLKHAGIRLGRDYPQPMVAHDMARTRALDALAQVTRPGDDDRD